MSTIKQVAKAAHVSVATVSRVINNPTSVNKETRAKVLQTIKDLNYTPNFIGRSLRKTKTNLILVLVHAIDNPFFAKIISGIESNAHLYNYDVIIANNYGSKELGDRYIQMLRHHYIDGIILLSSELSRNELEAIANEYPLVQVVEYHKLAKANAICIDYYRATYELMENFIHQGKKNIGFISANIRQIISTQEKYRAYRDALKAHDLEILTKKIPLCEFNYTNAYQATQELLKNYPSTDAILTCSDLIACGAIAACQDKGKNIPKDIAISGFDNIYISDIYNPKITTVSHDTFQLGAKAMEIMLSAINHQLIVDQKIILPYKIIYRQSTKTDS